MYGILVENEFYIKFVLLLLWERNYKVIEKEMLIWGVYRKIMLRISTYDFIG